MSWRQHDNRSRSPNKEWISRAVVGFLRYPDKRPQGLQTGSDGSVLVSSLVDVWGSKNGLTAEDVLNVVYKNMDNNRGTKRFEVTQLPNGDTAIAAAARDGGGGRAKGATNAWGSSGDASNGWSSKDAPAAAGGGAASASSSSSWKAKDDWKSSSWQDAGAAPATDKWKDASTSKDAWSEKKQDSGKDAWGQKADKKDAWQDWKAKDDSSTNSWKGQDWKASSSSTATATTDAWQDTSSWGSAKSSWNSKEADSSADAGKWGSASGGLWPNGEKIQRWIGYMLRQPHVDKAGGWMDIDELLQAAAKEKPNFGLNSRADIDAMLKETDHESRFEVDAAANCLRKVPRNERGGQHQKSNKPSANYWGKEAAAPASNASTPRSSRKHDYHDYPSVPTANEPAEESQNGVWEVPDEDEDQQKEAYDPESYAEDGAPQPPPGEHWTQYEDKGVFWWYYDGPLGQWWLSSDTDKKVQRWVI
mmetsp:Transcript_78239/g.162449  ORF Transcript_78239/g.162449 Transcript_78239/m.162449 type:complete len:475 (-) Transcript_78239:70-1494(-)